MKLALPWGIFGAGNIGDEAMLEGFAELVRGRGPASTRIWVASRNPSHVADVVPDFKYFKFNERLSPLGWWALRTCNAYLIVGDTPVMDYLGPWPLNEIARIVALARQRRRKIACLGIGTETLLDDQSVTRMREEIAPFVRHWTVRNDEDRVRLANYGVDERTVTVAADLAWLVPPSDNSFGIQWLKSRGVYASRPLVGVSVTHDRRSLEKAPQLLAVVTEALDNIVAKHDVDVMLFPNETREGEQFDSWAFRGILSRADRPDRMFRIPNRYWHPRQAMSFVACCTVTLTMRYHFGLFSALQGVPFVSLSRLGKLSDLCRDLEWPYELALADARGDNLGSMVQECIRDRVHLSRRVEESARTLVPRARRNVRSLEAVLGEC